MNDHPSPDDSRAADRTGTSRQPDGDPRITEAMQVYLRELESGRIPDRDEFLARYPEIADQLDGQLDGLDFLHGVAPKVAVSQSAGAKTKPQADGDGILPKRATLGDFRLIRQIGHGGMGIVYEAEQLSLGRKVAVKVLPFAAMLDEQHRKRFQNEARAAATLDHPHIVPVHFVGQERGVHFFAMHLIEGQSLAELIEGLRGRHATSTAQWGRSDAVAAGRGSSITDSTAPRPSPGPESPTSPASGRGDETAPDFLSAITTEHSSDRNTFFRTAARIGAEAAEALEHAHQVGILHRDIKPGNLLIDTAGKLWVADFGLATIEQDERLTRTGGVVGTAAYMSPEQAADSHRIDGRSDVYSLGATLYELLTLRKHRADDITRADANRRLGIDVTSLRTVDAAIPADLETIVIKALSYDPEDRYSSAGALADDLRSFIDGREIKARRLTRVQRQARWLRRHRRLSVTAVAASFLLIAAFGTVMSVYSSQLASRGKELEAALTDANRSKALADQQTLLAEQRLERAEQSEQLAKNSEQQARKSEQEARQSELFARQMSYRSDTQRAFENFARHNLIDSSRMLAKQVPQSGQTDLRGVEWKLLSAKANAKRHLLGSHSGPATDCVAYPDGNIVATAGVDGLIHIWDSREKRKLRSFEPKIGPIQAMAISPDGKTLAVGGAPSAGLLGKAKVYLLDAESGIQKGAIQRHKTTIESIRFSPDGSLVAAGSRYEDIRLSMLDGTKLHSFVTDDRNETFAFSPDSQRIASTMKKQMLVRFWDCENGELVRDNPVSYFVSSICWSPTGAYVLVAGKYYPIVTALDSSTGATLANLRVRDSERSAMRAISISPDGQVISAGDSSGELHQWQANVEAWRSGRVSEGDDFLVEPTIDSMTIDSEQFTSIVHLASGAILSTHDSGHVCLADPHRSAAQISEFDFDITAATSAPDSAVFLGSSNGKVHRFDIVTGDVTQIVQASGSKVKDLATSDDGSRLAIVFGSNRVVLVDPRTQVVLWSQPGEPEEVPYRFRVTLSPDGRVVATAGHNNQLTVWETNQQEPILEKAFDGYGWSVALSPDGRMVARGGQNIDVFELSSGKLLYEFRGAGVSALQFSPDSRYLASGHDDGSTRLYDTASGDEHIMRSNSRAVRDLAFSADGQTIIAAGVSDGPQEIYLWDTHTREKYGTIANPLPECSPSSGVMFKVSCVCDRVIVCGIETPYAEIAIWDLANREGGQSSVIRSRGR